MNEIILENVFKCLAKAATKMGRPEAVKGGGGLRNSDNSLTVQESL